MTAEDRTGQEPVAAQSIKENVLKAIESGHLKMRPKWKFVTGAALVMASIAAGALVTLFVSSFIVFMLRKNGVWFVPDFGREGLGTFITSLPWLLVVVAAILIALLEILIRRYSFAYGRPVLYSALGVILIMLIGGLGIGLSSFHEDLFERTERGEMPFGAPWYQHFMQQPDNVTVGTITAILGGGYEIEGPRDEIFTVSVTAQTKLPMENNLKVGDNIVILGIRAGHSIQAVAIEKPASLPAPFHYNRALLH